MKTCSTTQIFLDPGEFAEVLAGGLAVSLMSDFGELEHNQMDHVAINGNPRCGALAAAEHASITCRIRVAAAIALVLDFGRFTQVGDPVVVAAAVDVVQMARRPLPMVKQPCEAMSKIAFVLDPDPDITVRAQTASNSPDAACTLMTDPPADESGLGIGS